MAEGTSLLRMHTAYTCIVGSNPTVSARTLKTRLGGFFHRGVLIVHQELDLSLSPRRQAPRDGAGFLWHRRYPTALAGDPYAAGHGGNLPRYLCLAAAQVSRCTVTPMLHRQAAAAVLLHSYLRTCACTARLVPVKTRRDSGCRSSSQATSVNCD